MLTSVSSTACSSKVERLITLNRSAEAAIASSTRLASVMSPAAPTMRWARPSGPRTAMPACRAQRQLPAPSR